MRSAIKIAEVRNSHFVPFSLALAMGSASLRSLMCVFILVSAGNLNPVRAQRSKILVEADHRIAQDFLRYLLHGAESQTDPGRGMGAGPTPMPSAQKSQAQDASPVNKSSKRTPGEAGQDMTLIWMAITVHNIAGLRIFYFIAIRKSNHHKTGYSNTSWCLCCRFGSYAFVLTP